MSTDADARQLSPPSRPSGSQRPAATLGLFRFTVRLHCREDDIGDVIADRHVAAGLFRFLLCDSDSLLAGNNRVTVDAGNGDDSVGGGFEVHHGLVS